MGLLADCVPVCGAWSTLIVHTTREHGFSMVVVLLLGSVLHAGDFTLAELRSQTSFNMCSMVSSYISVRTTIVFSNCISSK